jgi:hypothetical protein
MSDYNYVSQELDLFAGAVNWKAYVRRCLAPYIRGDVLEVGRTFYMDSVGMPLSLGNRLILNEGMPRPAQIWLWDRVFVRCSRVVDPLTRGRLGKSIVGIWRVAGRRPDRPWDAGTPRASW